MAFQFSTAELKRIKRVQFGILSPEEIKQMSVCQVEYPETYEIGSGKPKASGLLDPRMGTIDRHMKCESCSGSMSECPGHFGHIELAKPVFHIGFIALVLKILRCVCFHCSKLLTDQSDMRFVNAVKIKNPKLRQKAVYNICKGINICAGGDETEEQPAEDGQPPKPRHGGCGGYQPSIKKDGFKINAEFKQLQDDSIEKKQVLTAEKVHAILKRISNDDCEAMGLNPEWARPDWLIITVLPCPPPPVRPSILMDAFSRGEDDLTHKLAEIIKYNANLRKQELNGAPAHIIQEFSSLLQFHLATYVNNELPGQPQVSRAVAGRLVSNKL